MGTSGCSLSHSVCPEYAKSELFCTWSHNQSVTRLTRNKRQQKQRESEQSTMRVQLTTAEVLALKRIPFVPSENVSIKEIFGDK